MQGCPEQGMSVRKCEGEEWGVVLVSVQVGGAETETRVSLKEVMSQMRIGVMN
jgi:hypothetical protein